MPDHAAPSACSVHHARRDRTSFGPFVHVPGDPDLALAVGRIGPELLVRIGPLRVRDGPDDRVRGGEDPGPGAEVGVQGEAGRRPAVRPREPLRELEQVVERCPPPRVDVLVGIADRGHRMTSAEERVHEVSLSHVRVLVLVQEHGAEPRAVIGDDLRIPLRDLDRAVDLVAEVDHTQFALELPVPRTGFGELQPFLRGFVHPVGSCVLEQLEPRRDVGLDLHGAHPVVLSLLVELEDLRHERRLPRRRRVFERHPVEHARAELGPLRLREDPGPRLEPGEHAVPLQERCREPVVVLHLGLFALGELQRGERATDAQPQVVGGLVREREAQDVAREHALLGVDAVDPTEGGERQVDDASGHHRGLARAGAGDQYAGFERPRDGSPLLIGRLGAHRRGDLRGDHGWTDGAHRVPTSKTCRPSGQIGQRVRKSHQKQSAWGLGR